VLTGILQNFMFMSHSTYSHNIVGQVTNIIVLLCNL